MEELEEEKQAASQVKITDVIYTTLQRWPWILLSLFICLGLAYIYLLRTAPTFERSASIVIKDDDQGSSLGDVSGISELGFVKTNSNLLDEINKLKSPDIMMEVVRRLHLDKNYAIDGQFHDDVLYGSTLPITVDFPGLLDTRAVHAVVGVSPDGKVSISDLRFNNKDYDQLEGKTFHFGDTIRTPQTAIVVNRSQFFRPGSQLEVIVDKMPFKTAVDAYSNRLSVVQNDEDSNTINLTFSDVSTQRAEDLLNTVINIYNEKWLEDRNLIATSTSRFIDERLKVIERDLGNVDQNISSYQSEHLIPDVQQAGQMYMTENQAVSSEILALNNQLQMSRYMKEFLANSTNRLEILPQNSGIGSTPIETQIAAYNQILLERSQLSKNENSTHPVVLDYDAKLAGMRQAIIAAIDNQIVALNTQIRGLQGSKSQTQAQIAATPTQAKYLLSVERQQKVMESLYLFLLQKREENELSQAFTAYNTQVIKSPYGSNSPTAPHSLRILAVAFLLGLFFPFGIEYLRQLLNTRVRGRKDLDQLTIPLLGEIPSMPAAKGESKKTRLVVKQGKRDVINEAFRVLRTNIGFLSSKDNGSTVIMVTSFNPGSGKTFISVNLGVALAIKGKRVLVIDGDLRRCSSSAYVGNPEMGLSNYLVGSVNDLGSIIKCDTIVRGLCILPVGTIPPNPTELLESDRFSQMLSILRREYDYILIDCPPIEMMADAQIIESMVDRTIFVIRAGLFERSMLPEIQKLYDSKKVRFMSLILNDTATTTGRYGSKYGYGYGYNYGYGYTK